jgi:hypothetical protein
MQETHFALSNNRSWHLGFLRRAKFISLWAQYRTEIVKITAIIPFWKKNLAENWAETFIILATLTVCYTEMSPK